MFTVAAFIKAAAGRSARRPLLSRSLAGERDEEALKRSSSPPCPPPPSSRRASSRKMTRRRCPSPTDEHQKRVCGRSAHQRDCRFNQQTAADAQQTHRPSWLRPVFASAGGRTCNCYTQLALLSRTSRNFQAIRQLGATCLVSLPRRVHQGVRGGLDGSENDGLGLSGARRDGARTERRRVRDVGRADNKRLCSGNRFGWRGGRAGEGVRGPRCGPVRWLPHASLGAKRARERTASFISRIRPS